MILPWMLNVFRQYKIFGICRVEKRLQLRLNNIGGPKTSIEKKKDVLLNYYIVERSPLTTAILSSTLELPETPEL